MKDTLRETRERVEELEQELRAEPRPLLGRSVPVAGARA